MPFCRASSLDRVLACDGSLYLPTAELRSPSTIEAAEWGTYVHSYVQLGVVPPAPPGRGQYPARLRDRIESVGDVLALWPREGARFEQSVAYHVQTGEVRTASLASKEEQDAWKNSHDHHWVVGTMDYLGSLLGRPWVDDLKTGRYPSLPTSAQTVFYSLCADRLAGTPPDGVYTSITHWPRYPVGGKPERVGIVLEWDDLEDFADLLEQTWEKSQARIKPLTPGEWCRYCPSRGNCPVAEVFS